MNFYWVFWSVSVVFLGYKIVSLMIRIEKHLEVLATYKIMDNFREKLAKGEVDPMEKKAFEAFNDSINDAFKIIVLNGDEDD